MKRPIIWALAFLCMGVASGLLSFFHINDYYMILIISMAALFTAVICVQYRWLPAAAFFVFFVLGLMRINQSMGTDKVVQHWVNEGDSLRIAGYVLETDSTNTGRARIVFEARLFQKESESHAVNMRILAILPKGRHAEIGEGLVLSGKLLNMDEARNPGAFNEFLYYRTRKIKYKCFPDIKAVSGYRGAAIGLHLSRWREKLAGVYNTILPDEQASIIRSVILGDRSGLEETIQDLYRSAGVYHLLFVSGLHISIVSLLVYRLMGIFLDKRRAGVINLALLILYCLFTGAGTGTVRAVIMAGIVIAGEVLFRERDLPSSIGFAAACMLIYEPLYICDAGFQLSFSAVFGISVLTAPVYRALSRLPLLPHIVRNAAASGLAAVLATFPCLLYHFYLLTPYAFFANLIIMPTVFILIGMGIITGGIGLFSISAAEFTAGSLYMLLGFYRTVCEFFHHLPGSEILAGSSGLWLTLLLMAAILLLAFWLSGRPEQMKKRGYLFLFSLVICAVTALYHYRKPDFEITMLDVGQGDAFVIRQGERVFVLDGGGLPNAQIGANTGRRILVPYLDYIGVSRINGVFVSHPDTDHALGIIELLPQKKIERLYFSYIVPRDNDIYMSLIEACQAKQIPVSYLSKGDTLNTGQMSINTLFPAKDDNLTGNDTSLVLQLLYDRAAVLFTGDIGSGVEKRLKYISPTVLKLSHHGSKYSNDEEFLRNTAPPFAIVGTGRNNVYGMPAPEVLECLRRFGIPLYNTAEHGAVTFTFQGKGFSVKTMIKMRHENNERA